MLAHPLLTPRWTPRKLIGKGLQAWYSAKRSPITRAAGMAAQFTAATFEYLSHAGNAALRGQTGTGGWWRSGWIYLDTADARTIEDCLGTNVGYKLSTNATPALVLEAGNGSATATATHGTTLGTATWYFFYVQYDGVNISVNINNGTAVTAALATYSSGATAWNMGALVTPATYFNGRMQCMMGDDGTLTAAQQTALYNAGTPLAHDQLPFVLSSGIGWIFELNEPSGTRTDLGSAGLTLTDNATVTTAAGTCLNAVSQWDDLSGKGYHATQATQANKPNYRARAINGFPGLRFYTGGSQYLSANSLALLFAGQDIPSSVVFVGKPAATGGSGRFVELSSTTNANPFMNFCSQNVIDTWSASRRDDVPNPAQGPTHTVAVTAVPHIISCVFTGTAISLGIDGVVETDDTADVGTCTFDAFDIGRLNLGGATNAPLDGYVCEVIILDRAINLREQRQIERYLSREYGVALAA